MLVSQILSTKAIKDVATISPDAKVSEAAGELSSKRIGALVVSSDGKSVDGIISERDIVRELGRTGVTCLDGAVGELMTKKIIGCTGDETTDAVLQKMTDGRFRHMPVMDGNHMVGLISIGDVVKARLSELSMEKDALEGMIMGH